VRRAAQLVANSRYTAGRLRQLYRREADAIVSPGVDLAQFRPAERPTDPAYAITVGRLSPEKGLDRLLDLWHDMPDLPLLVVGDGPPAVVRELRSRAPSSVVFRGRLTGEALAEAYRHATVAVFAPHAEEFGMAPLEAMASGVPVVAWRSGGLQESVVDGETGYLVDDAVTLRQRLRLLLHDPARTRALARAARQRAANFSWNRTALEMEAVCERVLAETPARSPDA
jgi:glycosyltransferase involved in cell wall biosynthesis